jgi:hypothetical protein
MKLLSSASVFSRQVQFIGAVILIASNAPAQNLFVANFNGDSIIEITPGGVQNTFATGMDNPIGLAFDSAGDLFVANASNYAPGGYITKITPGGVQSTFASGLIQPGGLAFNSAGNLFVGNGTNITEITPGGVQTTFSSGLYEPTAMAFNNAGDLFVADWDGDIYEYTPGGAQSIFATGSFAANAIAFEGETLPVPEPSALAVLAVGATALLVCRRKLAA